MRGGTAGRSTVAVLFCTVCVCVYVCVYMLLCGIVLTEQ